jgi:hypothetical protein
MSSNNMPPFDIDAWVEAQKKNSQPLTDDQLDAFRTFFESSAADLSDKPTLLNRALDLETKAQ